MKWRCLLGLHDWRQVWASIDTAGYVCRHCEARETVGPGLPE